MVLYFSPLAGTQSGSRRGFPGDPEHSLGPRGYGFNVVSTTFWGMKTIELVKGRLDWVKNGSTFYTLPLSSRVVSYVGVSRNAVTSRSCLLGSQLVSPSICGYHDFGGNRQDNVI